MLIDNYAEVCEPFVFEKVSSISDYRETIVKAEGIRAETTLSKLLEAYIDKDNKKEPATAKEDKEKEKEPAQESQSEDESEEESKEETDADQDQETTVFSSKE